MFRKLKFLYKDVGAYNYAKQYEEAKITSEKLLQERWGEDVTKEILLQMFDDAIWELKGF